MLNIIKMDLYKMFKSKSFYTLNIVLIVIIIFMGLFLKLSLLVDYETAKDSNLSYTTQNKTLDTNDPEITEEEYYVVQKEIADTMDTGEFIKFQYSGVVISILLSIFLAIFICSEFDSGFIKNIVPLQNSRINLVISKNIIILIFIIIQAVITFISSVASNFIISGKVNISDIRELIIYISLQVLLRMVFASLLILISYISRSKSTAMSIGILLSVNIHGLFLKFLDGIVNIFNFELSDLSIIGNTKMDQFSPEDYKWIIIMSIVYFILYNIISITRVKKMEIN